MHLHDGYCQYHAQNERYCLRHHKDPRECMFQRIVNAFAKPKLESSDGRTYHHHKETLRFHSLFPHKVLYPSCPKPINLQVFTTMSSNPIIASVFCALISITQARAKAQAIPPTPAAATSTAGAGTATCTFSGQTIDLFHSSHYIYPCLCVW